MASKFDNLVDRGSVGYLQQGRGIRERAAEFDSRRDDALVAGRSRAYDVAQALFDRHASNGDSLTQELSTFFEWSLPTVLYRAPGHEIDPSPPVQSLLFAVPKGQAGDELSGLFQEQSPTTRVTILRDGDDCVFCRFQAHSSLARMLPKWVLDAKPLFETARSSRLSPEIFPVLQPV